MTADDFPHSLKAFMGMELVEIVVRVEEAFNISIADADATRLTTPREVADFVATKVLLSDEPSCLSQQAFYFLRERFQPLLSFSREAFRPTTPLEQLVPKQNRQLVWAALQAEIGADTLPSLARPRWLFCLLAAATVLVFCSATFFTWNMFGGNLFLSLFYGLAAAVACGFVAAVATRPAQQNFRRGCQNLGEAARSMAAHQPHIIKRNERAWTRAQILSVVRDLIAGAAGSADFADDADFIRDLHLG